MLWFSHCPRVKGDPMKKIFIASHEGRLNNLLYQILNYYPDKNVELIIPEQEEEFQYVIKREVPDIIFVDIRLNYSVHIELMELFEKDEALYHSYKILLTEKFNYSKERELWQSLMDLCIYMPFDVEFILQKTATLLE